jgi:hypothetical protein
MRDPPSVLLFVVLQSTKETDAEGYKQAASSAAQHASNGCTIYRSCLRSFTVIQVTHPKNSMVILDSHLEERSDERSSIAHPRTSAMSLPMAHSSRCPTTLCSTTLVNWIEEDELSTLSPPELLSSSQPP